MRVLADTAQQFANADTDIRVVLITSVTAVVVAVVGAVATIVTLWRTSKVKEAVGTPNGHGDLSTHLGNVWHHLTNLSERFEETTDRSNRQHTELVASVGTLRHDFDAHAQLEMRDREQMQVVIEKVSERVEKAGQEQADIRADMHDLRVTVEDRLARTGSERTRSDD